MPKTDVIERAKMLLTDVFDLEPDRYIGARGIIRQLITELETTRAELKRLK
jgi:hypothetical protein